MSKWLNRIWQRLRGRRVERELDDELQAYVSLLTEEKLRSGLSGAAARRAALLETGGVEQVKERVRDVRSWASVEVVLRDVRHAFRSLRRSPGFTLVAVLALGLGMGATVAIFSVVDAVLLRPLRYPHAEQLVTILHNGNDPVSPANYLDWSQAATDFAEMSAAEYWSPSLAGVDVPEKVIALRVTPNLLAVIGVSPVLGRSFLSTADQPGQDREVLLSHHLWQRRFGGEARVIGQTLELDGEAYSIVGVMPEGFRFAPFWATQSELWAPLSLQERATHRNASSLRVFARLLPGVHPALARERMSAITTQLEAAYPGSNRDVTVTPLQEKVVAGVRPALLVLLSAVAFLLLMSCANVAHMLLARASNRQREVALRAVVGASRARLIRQFLTESLVLAALGGLLGVILGAVGVRTLSAFSIGTVPRMDEVTLDARVLLFTMLVTLLTGIMFGLAPARHAARKDLGELLREGERGSTQGVIRSRLRGFLIASEFALALILLTGAGLMARSFMAIHAIDPGFDARNVLSMEVSLTGTVHAEPGRRSVFFQQALERVRTIPGVVSASAINHLPLAGDIWGMPFIVEGQPLPAPGERPSAAYRVVLPGYLETMRMEIVRGRTIRETDDFAAPRIVVVNEALAARLWPGQNAIGKRINWGHPDSAGHWLTVAGVVRNAVRSDWAAPPASEVYLPYLQNHSYLEAPGSHITYMTFVMRTASDPLNLVTTVRSAVNGLDRDVALSRVMTMEQAIGQATSSWRFNLVLLISFAIVALVLATIGIYGVLSYAVARRTHEIGIRIALGARRSAVVGMIVSQAMLLVLAGSLAGLSGAFALTRLMSTMLYGVGATDPITFAAVWLLLCGVALCATCVPAMRAVRLDPLHALRESS